MAWSSLGVVTPTLTWQLFNTPTLSSTFRVTYQGQLDKANTFGYLRQYLSGDEVTKSIRIYPKTQHEIIELPLPFELRQAGLAIRYLGVMKFPARRFRYTLSDTNWSLQIEEWL